MFAWAADTLASIFNKTMLSSKPHVFKPNKVKNI